MGVLFEGRNHSKVKNIQRNMLVSVKSSVTDFVMQESISTQSQLHVAPVFITLLFL